MHVVRRLAELLEVRTHGFGRDTGIAVGGECRRTCALRQLLAVRPEQQAVVDVLRRLEAERAGELALELGVRAVVGAADHVRDLEVVVVDDARQMVGRAAVRAQERRPPEADGAVGVRLADGRRRLAMPVGALALAHRPLVPRAGPATRGRRGSPRPRPRPPARDRCRRSAAASSRRDAGSRPPRGRCRDGASPSGSAQSERVWTRSESTVGAAEARSRRRRRRKSRLDAVAAPPWRRRDHGGDRQPEAAAVGGARLVGAGEPLERVLEERRLEAVALVEDVQLDDTVLLQRSELDLAAAMAERVVDEIPQRLLEPEPVGL